MEKSHPSTPSLWSIKLPDFLCVTGNEDKNIATICIFHLSFLTSLEKKYHQKTCWDEYFHQNENYKAGFSHSWCELDFLIRPMMQLLPINRPTLDRRRGDFRLNLNLTHYEVRINRGNSGSLNPWCSVWEMHWPTQPLSSSSHNADTEGLMSVPFIAPVGQRWSLVFWSPLPLLVSSTSWYTWIQM